MLKLDFETTPNLGMMREGLKEGGRWEDDGETMRRALEHVALGALVIAP